MCKQIQLLFFCATVITVSIYFEIIIHLINNIDLYLMCSTGLLHAYWLLIFIITNIIFMVITYL